MASPFPNLYWKRYDDKDWHHYVLVAYTVIHVKQHIVDSRQTAWKWSNEPYRDYYTGGGVNNNRLVLFVCSGYVEEAEVSPAMGWERSQPAVTAKRFVFKAGAVTVWKSRRERNPLR